MKEPPDSVRLFVQKKSSASVIMNSTPTSSPMANTESYTCDMCKNNIRSAYDIADTPPKEDKAPLPTEDFDSFMARCAEFKANHNETSAMQLLKKDIEQLKKDIEEEGMTEKIKEAIRANIKQFEAEYMEYKRLVLREA